MASRFATAVHEAAHAVGSIRFENPDDLAFVDVVPDDEAWGRTHFIPGRSVADHPAGWLISILLGPLAEGELKPWEWPPPFDLAITTSRERLGLNLRRTNMTEAVWKKIVLLTHEIWNDPEFKLAVYTVAERLDRDGVLSGEEVRALVREANPSWPSSPRDPWPQSPSAPPRTL